MEDRYFSKSSTEYWYGPVPPSHLIFPSYNTANRSGTAPNVILARFSIQSIKILALMVPSTLLLNCIAVSTLSSKVFCWLAMGCDGAFIDQPSVGCASLMYTMQNWKELNWKYNIKCHLLLYIVDKMYYI